jgi:signal transduction histidine kinase/DNA-binding response OmpR family regulator
MVRRRSLRVKFVLAIGALVAVVLLANGLVQALAGRRILEHDIEERALAHAALAVGPVCTAYELYYTSGFSKFRELVLETSRLEPDLAWLEIYDTSGTLLFDSRTLALDGAEARAAAPARTAPDERLRRAVRGMDLLSWRVDIESQPTFVTVAPYVEEWGRHRYSVAFYASYRSLRGAAEAATWRIAWLSAGSLALGVLIAVVLSSQSLGPVDALTRGARDLADGQLGRRIQLRTGDEFEVLASTFNQMAEHLQRNVSDLEASNRTLNAMNSELQQLDRMKSDLLANVSHELRTPLTAIQGYAEAMDEGLLGEISSAQSEALTVVRRNGKRLMAMIEQLLSFSRLESGKVRIEPAAFDLAEVINQSANGVRAARGPGFALAVDLDGRLPLVWGDPSRIAQVLDNLLTNAAKFSPPGSLVTVSARRRGEDVEVAVSDRGIGIARGDREKVFERFFQADASSTRKYGGMGLGLSIVREIVQAHGREITVVSELGRGSTFSFGLPVAAEQSRAAASVGRTLLLIDDDPAFVQMLAGYLARAGYKVHSAGTAREGAAMIGRLHPDLVVLDRLLPDGDGFDLLAELKRDEATRATPVLVLSVRRERPLGLRLGASGYLVKPVPPERVLDAVRLCLGEPGASSARVLVVDDEADTRSLLLERLALAGFEVSGAADGESALAATRSLRPALVLLDLMMPGMDGWEVLRRLRSEPATAELPVIVLTGRDLAGDRALGEELHVVDVLNKPFDLGHLVDEIESALGRRSSRRENEGPATGDAQGGAA